MSASHQEKDGIIEDFLARNKKIRQWWAKHKREDEVREAAEAKREAEKKALVIADHAESGGRST